MKTQFALDAHVLRSWGKRPSHFWPSPRNGTLGVKADAKGGIENTLK